MTAMLFSIIQGAEVPIVPASQQQGLGLGAWLLLIFGCVVLYGGLIRSFIIAHNASKKAGHVEYEEEEEVEEVPGSK